jgi:hypothetical protein
MHQYVAVANFIMRTFSLNDWKIAPRNGISALARKMSRAFTIDVIVVFVGCIMHRQDPHVCDS